MGSVSQKLVSEARNQSQRPETSLRRPRTSLRTSRTRLYGHTVKEHSDFSTEFSLRTLDTGIHSYGEKASLKASQQNLKSSTLRSQMCNRDYDGP